jgi:hypothetical protein
MGDYGGSAPVIPHSQCMRSLQTPENKLLPFGGNLKLFLRIDINKQYNILVKSDSGNPYNYKMQW